MAWRPQFAPISGTFITQTPNGDLTNEQALSSLNTGILKNTTGTGVLSIATYADLPTQAYVFLSGDSALSSWNSSGTGTPVLTYGDLGQSIDTSASTNDTHNRWWRGEKNLTRLNFNTPQTGEVWVYQIDIRGYTGSATDTHQFGLLNATTFSTQDNTRGILFRDTGSQIQAVTADGTSTTATNITVGGWQNEIIRCRAVWTVGTDVKFYVNDTLKATHTTNIPSGANTMYLGAGIKTGTTAAKSLIVARNFQFYQLS